MKNAYLFSVLILALSTCADVFSAEGGVEDINAAAKSLFGALESYLGEIVERRDKIREILSRPECSDLARLPQNSFEDVVGQLRGTHSYADQISGRAYGFVQGYKWPQFCGIDIFEKF